MEENDNNNSEESKEWCGNTDSLEDYNTLDIRNIDIMKEIDESIFKKYSKDK